MAQFQSLTIPTFSPDRMLLGFVGPITREGRNVPAVFILDMSTGHARQEIQHEDWHSIDASSEAVCLLFSMTWSTSSSFVLVRTFVSELNKEWLTVVRFDRYLN